MATISHSERLLGYGINNKVATAVTQEETIAILAA